MGRANRDKMKRKLVASYNRLEASYEGIAFLHALFAEAHPDMAEGLVIAAELISQSQEVLIAFGERAWNLDKSRYDSYK
jgi:hypothetical protein